MNSKQRRMTSSALSSTPVSPMTPWPRRARPEAPGGTILKARGTASGEDAQFFGLTLFPEKEVLLMLVPGDKAEAVRQAVKEADCLKNPGMGIAFSASVDDFFSLGKI